VCKNDLDWERLVEGINDTVNSGKVNGVYKDFYSGPGGDG